MYLGMLAVEVLRAKTWSCRNLCRCMHAEQAALWHHAGKPSFRELLRSVRAAATAAREAPAAPLPAIAQALGVSLGAESFPVFQTAVALCAAEHHQGPLMQQASNALGVRTCRPRMQSLSVWL